MVGIGSPPFRFIAERLLRDDDIRADLKNLSSIDTGRFETLARALAAQPHFLDRASLAEVVNKSLSEEDAKVVRRITTRFNQVIRDSDDTVEEALLALQSEMQSYEEDFSSPTTIVQRLRELILVPQGLARQKKAEALAEATGIELSEIGIFCDVRPVFDDERKKVEGAVVVAIMRVEVFNPDGLAEVVECRLTERQLERLCKISDEARRKMVVLKELMASKNIPVAKVSDDGGKPK
jgi:hypothetical protein